MYKCLFYNIWFGKIPPYFKHHCKTCNINKSDYHWIVYTDQVNKQTSFSEAITAYPYNWDMLIKDFQKIDVEIEKPKKITRPVTKTLGQCRLFMPVIRNDFPKTQYWGITEFDVIYGNLNEYLLNIENYLVISGDPRAGCGPFSIFRHDCEELILNYPNLKIELEDNSHDTIETNLFLLYFEDHGQVKRNTGLQPFRESLGFTAGHWATWEKGEINVFHKEEQKKAGIFHFGGQRKRPEFKITKKASNNWKISHKGIENLKKRFKQML